MAKKLAFDSEEYLELVRRYDSIVRLLDQTIYDLCAAHPDHKDAASVHAKVWIIARTLSSGLERAIKSAPAGQGAALSRVSETFLKNAEEIDSIIADLKKIREPLSTDKLQQIIIAHAKILRLLRPIVRKVSPRSFVSKYLHFHNSAVPIYDNMARRSLRHLALQSPKGRIFQTPRSADEKYAEFCARFFDVYEQVRSKDLPLTVKHLDHYLVREASRYP